MWNFPPSFFASPLSKLGSINSPRRSTNKVKWWYLENSGDPGGPFSGCRPTQLQLHGQPVRHPLRESWLREKPAAKNGHSKDTSSLQLSERRRHNHGCGRQFKGLSKQTVLFLPLLPSFNGSSVLQCDSPRKAIKCFCIWPLSASSCSFPNTIIKVFVVSSHSPLWKDIFSLRLSPLNYGFLKNVYCTWMCVCACASSHTWQSEDS